MDLEAYLVKNKVKIKKDLDRRCHEERLNIVRRVIEDIFARQDAGRRAAATRARMKAEMESRSRVSKVRSRS